MLEFKFENNIVVNVNQTGLYQDSLVPAIFNTIYPDGVEVAFSKYSTMSDANYQLINLLTVNPNNSICDIVTGKFYHFSVSSKLVKAKRYLQGVYLKKHYPGLFVKYVKAMNSNPSPNYIRAFSNPDKIAAAQDVVDKRYGYETAAAIANLSNEIKYDRTVHNSDVDQLFKMTQLQQLVSTFKLKEEDIISAPLYDQCTPSLLEELPSYELAYNDYDGVSFHIAAYKRIDYRSTHPRFMQSDLLEAQLVSAVLDRRAEFHVPKREDLEIELQLLEEEYDLLKDNPYLLIDFIKADKDLRLYQLRSELGTESYSDLDIRVIGSVTTHSTLEEDTIDIQSVLQCIKINRNNLPPDTTYSEVSAMVQIALISKLNGWSADPLSDILLDTISINRTMLPESLSYEEVVNLLF